ncbi:MAG: hypothetical protein WD512_08660, partial [Candidatus Paceibacterota bacterium]
SVKTTSQQQHYINHATYSPDGEIIGFFHLWSFPSDVNRQLQFMVIKKSTKEIKILETERIVSHYCWRNEKEILATTRTKEGVWFYTLYNINQSSRHDLNIPLNVDGHPMFNPANRDLIITDTYPDKRNDQHLCIADLSGEAQEVGAFYSPFKYKGQVRCDLHPRWDRQGKFVVVDTTKNKIRKMAILNI